MPESNFNEIETSRLVLRPFRKHDTGHFVQYRSDPEVARYQSWESCSREEGERFIRSVMITKFDQPGTWVQLAVALKESDQLIGDFGIHTLEDFRQVELGITMSRSFQGKGYASEALGSLLGYLFRDLNKHRVYAITDAKNTSAQRLFERAGFRKEAHFVENTWFKGEWGSEYLYAMLQREWLARDES